MFEKISVCDRQSREGQTEEKIGPSELFFEISSEDPLETKLGFERITWSLFSNVRSHHKNGSPSKAIRLQSSGSLFVIRGRTIYYVDGIVSTVIPFEICLDDAQTIESFQGKKTPESNEFKADLRNQSRITIIASNFPKAVCPISKLTLTFVIGEHYGHDTGCRPVLLCKGQIEMDDTVKSYIPGSKLEGVQHLFDHITLLSTQIDLPTESKKGSSSIIPKKDDNNTYFDYLSELPNVILKIFILSVLLGIIWQPLGFIILPSIPTQHMWILLILSYILQAVRIVLFLVMILLFFLTPLRSDILQDIPIHFCAHLRSLFNLSESSGGRMSFHVHGWNAWGFCGTVKQGKTVPLYAMPHVCVRAFHSGGPAFDINFGRGTDARTRRTSSLPAQDREYRSYARDRRDYIASDMFTVLADTVEKKGVVCGFLGQKEQFGCIAANRAYDHMSVHLDCDGAVCSPKGIQGTESSQEVACTDWLYIELQDRVREDPLASYLEMAGKMNGTDKLFHSSTCSSNEGDVITPASPVLPLDNSIAKREIRGDQLKVVNAVRDRDGEDEEDDLEEGVLLQLLHSETASALLSTVRHKVPAGWCSWYHFFEFVSEKDLMDNISAMLSLKVGTGMHADRMDFKLFQVDDGYQRAWGDWMQLHLARFPSQSMTLIVDKIKEASMTPGLWMAPFACDKHSRVAADHPDWVLRRPATLLDFKGKGEGVPANSANCGKWFYGLDVTNPSVRTHITSCITTATMGWKFEYLKLDFLYAAALKDAHESYFDKSKTRAQAMQVGLTTIADAMGPSVFLLGCGAPMGSVLGYVHANRVSSDAGLSWLPDMPLPFYDKWNLPCARNMVRNSVCRMMMHGRWWINDPDCILLRNTTHYSDWEIIGIATVKAMSGGSFIISDDLATVSPGRMRVAQQLLPASNISAVPLDLLDREMPELLRLQLGKHRGPQGAISASAGSHVISCLNDWTVFGNCNWGERRKRNQVSAEYLNLMPLNSIISSKKSSQSSSSSGSGSDINRYRKEDKGKAVQSNVIDASYSFQTKAETVSEAEEGERREQDFLILHVLEFWSSTYSYRLISSEHDSLSLSSTQSKDEHKAGKRRLIRPKDDLGFPAVEPHTASLYALRLTPCNSTPLYVGSNLHFTSGLEVTSFTYVMGPDRASNPDSQYLEKQELSNSCTIRFEHCAVRCQQWTGYVWLYLPYKDAQSHSPHSHPPAGLSKGGRGTVPLPVLEGDLAGCGGPELVENIVGPDSRISRSSASHSSGNEGSEDSLIGGRKSRGEDISEGEGEGEEGGRLLGRVWRVPVASPGHDENDELIVFWS